MPPNGIIDVMSKIHHTDGTRLDVADRHVLHSDVGDE
jgi:hypothetical protein